MEQADVANPADDDPTTARAKVILAEILRVPVDSLRPEADLVEDLGADDTALANVASLLEMDLGIDGLYEDIEDWETVEDILDSVEDAETTEAILDSLDEQTA